MFLIIVVGYSIILTQGKCNVISLTNICKDVFPLPGYGASNCPLKKKLANVQFAYSDSKEFHQLFLFVSLISFSPPEPTRLPKSDFFLKKTYDFFLFLSVFEVHIDSRCFIFYCEGLIMFACNICPNTNEG